MNNKLIKIGLAISLVLSILLCIDIFRIKAILDGLYFVAMNSHSGMVQIAIENTVIILFQRLMILLAVAIITVFGIMNWMWRKRFSATSLTLILFVLLMMNVQPLSIVHTNSITRYYARIEMDIPANPSIGDLEFICGDFTPNPAGVTDKWVTYHIGTIFPYTGEQYPEWLGGGYYTDTGITYNGTVFYIEWMIDGVYGEEIVEGVTFGEEYIVHISWGGGGVGSFVAEDVGVWQATIWDKEWNLMLRKDHVDMPTSGHRIITCAGGESIWADNRMEATFSGLGWRTYRSYPQQETHEGLWDGTEFSCSTIEDSPYSTILIEPYYHLTISGGYCKTLVISSHIGGITNPSLGIYGYATGSDVTIEALPNIEYTFQKWLYDGMVTNNNPIDLVMDTDHDLEAFFQNSGENLLRSYLASTGPDLYGTR